MKTPPAVVKKLTVFWSAAVVATVLLGIVFLRVPEAIGINRYEVKAEFAQGAGLYEGAEVTYLGHPVGKVSDMRLGDGTVVATLKLKDDVDVPDDVTAEIHSRSAVGEQYVDLVPAGGVSAAALGDGDVIPVDRTSYPVEIGPVLDNVYDLVESVDSRNLGILLDETGRALYGRAGDLQSILDNGSDLVDLAADNIDPTRALIRDADPLLTTVNGKTREIRSLTGNLDQVTEELRAGDADLRTLLADGPGFSEETTRLLDDLGETLPPLLGPLNTISDVLAYYRGHLAATLGEYPRAMATVQSVTLPELEGAFVRLTLSNAADPPECTQGFKPAEQWSSPFENGPMTTPLLYCTLDSDDPRGVRGARNIQCPGSTAREGTAARCRD